MLIKAQTADVRQAQCKLRPCLREAKTALGERGYSGGRKPLKS